VLVATFLIINFSIFFLSLHMHIRTRHVSSNFLPCWLLTSGKPTAWLFNRLLIPKDQTKNLRDVMKAFLLYRCKHLFMLKFRVVFPSLIKKVYILHIAGYNNNKSDSMTSVM